MEGYTNECSSVLKINVVQKNQRMVSRRSLHEEKGFPLCKALCIAHFSLNCCPPASLFTRGLHLCPPCEPQVFLHSKFINTFPSYQRCLSKNRRIRWWSYVILKPPASHHWISCPSSGCSLCTMILHNISKLLILLSILDGSQTLKEWAFKVHSYQACESMTQNRQSEYSCENWGSKLWAKQAQNQSRLCIWMSHFCGGLHRYCVPPRTSGPIKISIFSLPVTPLLKRGKSWENIASCLDSLPRSFHTGASETFIQNPNMQAGCDPWLAAVEDGAVLAMHWRTRQRSC